MTHMLLRHGGILKSGAMTEQQYWGSLWSALVHDFEHGGLNNDFLIKTHHPLAITYNDQSPLENHHVSAASRLLGDPELAYLPVRSAVSMAFLSLACLPFPWPAFPCLSCPFPACFWLLGVVSLHQQLASTACPLFLLLVHFFHQLTSTACVSGLHEWGALLPLAPAVMSVHIEGRLPVWCCRMSCAAKQQLAASYATFQLAGLWRPGT